MEEQTESFLDRYLIKSVTGPEAAQKLMLQMHTQGYKPVFVNVIDRMPMSAEVIYHITFELK